MSAVEAKSDMLHPCMLCRADLQKQEIMNAGKELDLRGLYHAVKEMGGPEALTAGKKWSRAALAIGMDPAVVTNASFLCKRAPLC